MAKNLTCSKERIPHVQLALTKKGCLRSSGEKYNTAKAIAGLLEELYGCRPQEHFAGLFFDSQVRILSVMEVSVGGIAMTPVDPKVLFAGALTAGATAMVVAHNHPSGAPEPSQMDKDLTRQVQDGCRLLGIQFLDHVIIARGGAYFSFAENGLLK